MNPAADYQTIAFTRRRGATDLTWRVQTSTDLVVWNDDAVLVSVVENADGTDTLLYRCPNPLSAENRRFLRVSIATIP